jgi:glycine/D-amino acid oxidase-like deaminating enzyme
VFNRCCKYVPSLRDAQIVEKTFGFRPYRKDGVRLEFDTFQRNNKKMRIIHNYGHGGSGVTLSWGCAQNVAELIVNELKSKHISKL